ncbi:glycosyltransferase [Sphingomonas endolithica]|uniref:glycosyltransferase n=1 Tax=Sphingomonas endolithica TaxID=2972485 RepID=UPI0021AFF4F0|nr:glycosyltransferase [Sphingomonas sp. ZFBP2030]
MIPASRHIAIIAPPTPGHFNPLQALGTAMMAHGHRVTMVHIADAASLVREPDVGFAALDGSSARPGALAGYLARLADATGPIGLTRMIRATATMTEALLDHAPTLLERIGVDAVIADSAEPAGSLIARRIGVPYVVSVTGLPLLREPDVPPPFLGWAYRANRLGRFRNRGGYAVSDVLLRPITQVLDARRRAWGLEREGAPRLVVAQCPQGLDYPRTAPIVFGGPWRSVTREEPDLPADGRPLIFCSLGTLQGSRRRLFAMMAQACAAIGARAVIGHGGGLSAEQAAALPGDPLVRAFWPQEAILSRCVAAVLHGGFNSVLDALAAGVPIVALPIAFEQPGTAARVVRVGAGLSLSPRWLTVRSLSAALRTVTGNACYRRAAEELAAEMATAGGASQAAALASAALTEDGGGGRGQGEMWKA